MVFGGGDGFCCGMINCCKSVRGGAWFRQLRGH